VAAETNTLLGREKNLMSIPFALLLLFWHSRHLGFAIRTIGESADAGAPFCFAIDSPVLGAARAGYSLLQYSSLSLPVQVLSLRRAGHRVSHNKYPNTNRNPRRFWLQAQARWKSCKNLLFYPRQNEWEKMKRKSWRAGANQVKRISDGRLTLFFSLSRIQILESAMGCARGVGACTMNRPIINTKTMAKKGRRSMRCFHFCI
jgi:hypothetical protein